MVTTHDAQNVTSNDFRPTILFAVLNVFRAIYKMNDGFSGYIKKNRFVDIISRNRLISHELTTKLWRTCILRQADLHIAGASGYVISRNFIVEKAGESHLLLRELDPFWLFNYITVLRAHGVIKTNQSATGYDLLTWMANQGWTQTTREVILTEVVVNANRVEPEDLMRSTLFLTSIRSTIFTRFASGLTVNHFATLQQFILFFLSYGGVLNGRILSLAWDMFRESTTGYVSKANFYNPIAIALVNATNRIEICRNPVISWPSFRDCILWADVRYHSGVEEILTKIFSLFSVQGIISLEIMTEEIWLAAISSALGGESERLERFNRLLHRQRDLLKLQAVPAESHVLAKIASSKAEISTKQEKTSETDKEAINELEFPKTESMLPFLRINAYLTLLISVFLTICTMKMLMR